MQLDAVARTDPGLVREATEDCFLWTWRRALCRRRRMGGHARSPVPSGGSRPDVLLGEINPDETRLDRSSMDQEEEIRERLRYAMNQASISIRQAAMANPVHTGKGTTLPSC